MFLLGFPMKLLGFSSILIGFCLDFQGFYLDFAWISNVHFDNFDVAYFVIVIIITITILIRYVQIIATITTTKV